MTDLSTSQYCARLAVTKADLRAAQALRHRAFGLRGAAGLDRDPFDKICRHVLIEDRPSGRLVCCYRMMPIAGPGEISASYSAQFYELSALSALGGRMAEIGRFCILPGLCDPNILRTAWGAITRYVDENAVKFLFGCSSFKGRDPAAYQEGFALLKARHLAPLRRRPGVASRHVYPFAQVLSTEVSDARLAASQLPPLLRTYLSMGGWVSDHAVVDHALDTLHVFTGLEIDAIPAVRKRLLRAVAQ